MADHIPQELVEEILHRLPLKSLVRCTPVCKSWNALIKSQTFIYDHHNRTIIQSPHHKHSLFLQFSIFNYTHRPLRSYFFLMLSTHHNVDNFSVESFPLSHLFHDDISHHTLFAGSCNGLVCSADYFLFKSSNIIIWNPVLRKYIVLPKPIMTCTKRDHKRYNFYDFCFGLGFDYTCNDYKVVRLMNHVNTEETPHVEVYSLASHSWRSIFVRVPKFHLGDTAWLPPMFVNGALHRVVCRRTSDEAKFKFILSFDLAKETFGEFALPTHSNEVDTFISKLIAIEGGNSLGVINYARERHERVLSVWVMKDYGITHSWSEVFHCNTVRSYEGGIFDILALTSNEKVLASTKSGDIVLVDSITGLVEVVGHQAYSNVCVASYVQSPFLLNKEPRIFSF